jgi:hypothetical protein
VFNGGATLEAIEAVCTGMDVAEEQVLDLLGGLVNKSMVNVDTSPSGEMRYRLLETVRQYSREKLNDSNEIENLQARHLDYFAGFCEGAYPHIHGAGRLEWVRRLKLEHDNIREALEWSFHDRVLALKGLRIAIALSDRFWLPLGLKNEARQWLNTGLQSAWDEIPKLMQAEAYYSLIWASPNEELKNEARNTCISLCREIGPQADQVLCLALTLINSIIDDQYLSNLEEAIKIARTLGPAQTWHLGECLIYYSQRLFFHPSQAYDDLALAAAEESLQIHRNGDRWSVAGYWVIGLIQWLRGGGEQARKTFETELKIFYEIDDVVGITITLFVLIMVHRLAGRYTLSMQYCQDLFNCADSIANEGYYKLFIYSTGILLVNLINDSPAIEYLLSGEDAVKLVAFASSSPEKLATWIWYERIEPTDLLALNLLRHRLGEEVFIKVWQAGRALSLDEAITLALSVKIEKDKA